VAVCNPTQIRFYKIYLSDYSQILKELKFIFFEWVEGLAALNKFRPKM